ncbi:DUF6515 family protein [Coraliomargarita parva]|uniref:DUF6515 family protein n=1 Tax=Coraliomargarita parva TaxID=3014050 RepID=UPI0022B4DFAA|nr:DUF6515 family protein [Coraliomargarita parva]
MKTYTKASTLIIGAILSAGIPLSAQHKPGPERGEPSPVYKQKEKKPESESSSFFSFGISLPNGSIEIAVGDSKYYEHRGTFYQKGPHGYHVAKPPVGAVVPALPPGCVRFYSGGVVYFRYGDVCYREARGGYIIVEIPVSVSKTPVTPAEEYHSVWLNEREYLFKDGQFFVNTPNGLSWVEAPLGATTKILPSDAKSIWYQEIEYFESDDIFFRKTPDGYKVVKTPWK